MEQNISFSEDDVKNLKDEITKSQTQPSQAEDVDSRYDNEESLNEDTFEPKPTKKKNKRPTLKERQLIAQENALQEKLERLNARNRQLEAKLAEKNEYLNAYETLDKVQKDQSYKYDRSELISIMAKAEEEGDYETKIKAQELLTDLQESHLRESIRSEIESEYLLDNDEDDYNSLVAHAMDVDPDQYYNETFHEWEQENPWLADENLRQETNQVMEELNKRLTLQGASDYIGTPEYLEKTKEIVFSKYNIPMTHHQSQHQSMMNDHSMYAESQPSFSPVGSSTSEFSGGYNSQGPTTKHPWRNIQLSEAERDFALNAMGGSREAFNQLSQAEKLDRYKKLKWQNHGQRNEKGITFSI